MTAALWIALLVGYFLGMIATVTLIYFGFKSKESEQ